jgi:hypothetical protein
MNKSFAFFGREKEIEQLRSLHELREHVLIVGPAGIGKTSLLRQIRQHCPLLVCEDTSSMRRICDSIEQQLGWIHHKLNVIERKNRLLAHLEKRGEPVAFDQVGYTPPAVARFIAILAEKIPVWIACRSDRPHEIGHIWEHVYKFTRLDLVPFTAEDTGQFILEAIAEGNIQPDAGEHLDAGLAHCLKLVHFHVGSQVPDISTIKRAVREGARYYAKLFKLGHELGYLDVGGGLGVDYDGSRSDFDSSTNYSLQEYANDVVWNIMDVCDSEGVAHPRIVSESGRATVAHHSVLVVEAFGSIEKTPSKLKVEANEKDHKLVGDILDVKQRLKRGNRLESLHDIQQIKEESQQTFDLGLLDLESKAKIDTVYWQVAHQIVNMHRGLRYVPDEVKQLETALGDQYICNFSVFQSLLDHWALGQLFPIMPIHRLTMPPDRQGTIVDITCDSDGRVCKFVDLQDVKETLPLHRVHPGEIYYLGLFMVGAYQDIMGDLHNLFGRVTEVHVFLDPDEESGWYIEEVIEGSTIGEVLAMTQWDKLELTRLLKAQVDEAIKTDRLKPNDAMRLLDDYERFLQEYTYLSFNGVKAPPQPGSWLPLS